MIGDGLKLDFISDNKNQYSGFRARYTAVNNTGKQ